jgi:hypothetical protein
MAFQNLRIVSFLVQPTSSSLKGARHLPRETPSPSAILRLMVVHRRPWPHLSSDLPISCPIGSRPTSIDHSSRPGCSPCLMQSVTCSYCLANSAYSLKESLPFSARELVFQLPQHFGCGLNILRRNICSQICDQLRLASRQRLDKQVPLLSQTH